MALKFNCKHCGVELVPKFLKVGEEMKCSACGKTSTIPDNAKVIPDSARVIPDSAKSKASISNIKKSESKYPVLTTISGIYQFLAYLVFIASFFSFAYGVINFQNDKAVETSIIVYSLIAGLIGATFLLAISEGIKLFISIENNTSNQNKLLDKLIDKIKNK